MSNNGPEEIYLEIHSQDGEHRIQMWDTKPFEDATHVCTRAQPKETAGDAINALNKVEAVLKNQFRQSLEDHGVETFDEIDIIRAALSRPSAPVAGEALKAIEETLHHFADGLDGMEDGGYTKTFEQINLVRSYLCMPPQTGDALKALEELTNGKNNIWDQEISIYDLDPFADDHIKIIRAALSQAAPDVRTGLSRTEEIIVVDTHYGISESNIASGCEHGFKPATSCSNEYCTEKQAIQAWESIANGYLRDKKGAE